MTNGPTTMIRSLVSHPRAGAVALMAASALAASAASPALAAAAVSPTSAAFVLSPVGSSDAMLLHGTAGEMLDGAVSVRSVSNQPVTVILQPADIRNASTGNADYVTSSVSQTGRWLHLAASTVRLAPHATQRVAFTVTIPAGTTGASHYAGIVAIDAADLAPATPRKKATGTSFTFHRVSRQALPITIRLPGPLTRSLTSRFAKLIVEPVGASLELGLLPGGSELIESAQINVSIMRGSHTVFTYTSGLGQLFPDTPLNYRVPWQGTPTTGTYRVVGVFRPKDAAAVNIDTTVNFTDANAATLKRVTPPVAGAPSTGLPIWVWIALAAAAALLIALLVTVYKLSRRPPAAVT
jgi:hypothetical protein